jgi:hypothetical protein
MNMNTAELSFFDLIDGYATAFIAVMLPVLTIAVLL